MQDPLIVEPRDGFDILPDHVGHKIECHGFSSDNLPPWDVVNLVCMTCDVFLMGYATYRNREQIPF